MPSPIEEVIEDIEEYIDSCRPSAFSSSKIVVNRDEMDSFISELKEKIPEEVSRYQKIINNQHAILEDARRQAREIINAAEVRTNELISEHQIMERAYAQANEVVMVATKNAQNTIDSATSDANEIRSSAITYTDELLANIQGVLTQSVEATRANQDSYLSAMQGYLEVIAENRAQLSPNPIAEEILKAEPEPVSEAATEKTNIVNLEEKKSAVQAKGMLDVPESFFKKD